MPWLTSFHSRPFLSDVCWGFFLLWVGWRLFYTLIQACPGFQNQFIPLSRCGGHRPSHPRAVIIVMEEQGRCHRRVPFLSFLLHRVMVFLAHVACRLLDLQPRLKPLSPSAETGSLEHWIAQEFPPLGHLLIRGDVTEPLPCAWRSVTGRMDTSPMSPQENLLRCFFLLPFNR